MTTFTFAPHLAPFNTDLPTFSATKPGFTDFGVGGFIFSIPPCHGQTTTETKPNLGPKVLLLQRCLSDSFGGYWEGPGGGLDPTTDRTILEGAAREVLEESGLHVSRFVDLVAVDEWATMKTDGLHVVAKFTFLVEVHEAGTTTWGDATGGIGAVSRKAIQKLWEDDVKLAKEEHQAYAWATEEEVREGLEEKGPYRFANRMGTSLLKGFEMAKILEQ